MTYRFIKICVLLLCGVFAAATFAQNSNSTITGTVQDVSGAVVPGATIDLTNVGTGQQLSTTSKGNGFYSFTNLSPANYKVSVSAQGFAQWVGVLTLRVSQAAQVNPSLIAASVSTQVMVKDVTPVIDQVNATLSDVKESTRIETIPLSSRNVLQLLNFTPGVVANGFGGMGAGFTRVNGITGGSLDFLVDGQTMATPMTNELVANPQPIPTLQEVKIMTSNGNAQYSRPGIVEMVTKSGTNHFHGQLFELNQNTLLEAKAYRQVSIPYLMHNEFGGQIGGPVWLPKLYNGRNKTFFFVDLEGIRTNAFAASLDSVPTAQWKTGDLSTLVDDYGAPITVYDPLTTTLNPATGAYQRTQISYNGVPNVIPPNRINPVAAKLMTYLPNPNINIPYWQGPNYSDPTAASTLRNKLYTAKVDQLFGPNRLAMRYTYTDQSTEMPISSGYLLSTVLGATGGHNGAVVFTEVLGPRTVNIVRGGVNYSHNFDGPLPINNPSIESVLGLPTYTGNVAWPGILWKGVNDSDFSWIDSANPTDYPGATINGSDQLSYNRGNHQFMFGVGFQNTRINTYSQGQSGGTSIFSGNYTSLQNPTQVAAGTFDAPVPDSGSGFADMLLGDLDSTWLDIYPHYHTEQSEYSGFAQDDWRATQKLTLNLGVRYTYWTAFRDSSGLESNFDPTIPGGMVVYQGSSTLPALTSPAVLAAFVNAGLPIESAAQAGYPLSLWKMPKNNWDPRLGFAYQLTSKSVLRGGWGVYHWVMPLSQYQGAARKNPPFAYFFTLQPDICCDPAAAELEFPIASAQYGGPLNPNAFQWGSPGMVINTNALAISSGGGWQMFPMDINYKPSTVQEWNLTFEQELPAHTGAQLSYVGNRSTNLPQMDPINWTLPRELGPPGATPVQLRAFPNFTTSNANGMSELRDIGYGNDNQLNAQLTHTFGGGLLLQAFYTWSRTLGTAATEGNSNLSNAAMMVPAALTPGYTLSNYLSGDSDSARLRAVYGPDPYMPFHTFSINGHYEFPFGQGKRFLGNAHGLVNKLVSGYNISPFFYWHSGLFFAPYFTPFGSAVLLAPGKHGGELPESQRTPNRWFDASLAREDLGQPYTGQAFIERANTLDDDFRNNSPQNYMTGPGFNNLDASIYKLTPIGKGSMLDIEAQIFNVYNHINLGLPSFTSGVISTGVTNSSGNEGSRLIQLQAKFIF